MKSVRNSNIFDGQFNQSQQLLFKGADQRDDPVDFDTKYVVSQKQL